MRIRKLLFISFCFWSGFCQGCYTSSEILITNLKTLAHTHVPCHGEFREMILGVDDVSKVFCTLQRVDSAFVFRKRNYNGREMFRKELPLFNENYCGSSDIAVSLDWQYIAYFDNKKGSLNILSLKDLSVIVLVDKLASSRIKIESVYWISPNHILVLVDPDMKVGRKRSSFIKVNIQTKQTEEIQEDFYTSLNEHSLSPSRKYLVFVPQSDAGLMLLDVEKMSAKKILQPRDMLEGLRTPLCGSNENCIAYVSSSANSLLLIPGQGRSPLTLKEIPPKVGWVRLCAFDGRNLLYKIETREKIARRKYVLLSIDNHGEKIIDMEPNGNLYLINDGRGLLAEIGE